MEGWGHGRKKEKEKKRKHEEGRSFIYLEGGPLLVKNGKGIGRRAMEGHARAFAVKKKKKETSLIKTEITSARTSGGKELGQGEVGAVQRGKTIKGSNTILIKKSFLPKKIIYYRRSVERRLGDKKGRGDHIWGGDLV